MKEKRTLEERRNKKGVIYMRFSPPEQAHQQLHNYDLREIVRRIGFAADRISIRFMDEGGSESRKA